MTIVATNKDLQVRFNGSKTYFVSDGAGQCRLATTSKTKALNCMNRIAKEQGE